MSGFINPTPWNLVKVGEKFPDLTADSSMPNFIKPRNRHPLPTQISNKVKYKAPLRKVDSWVLEELVKEHLRSVNAWTKYTHGRNKDKKFHIVKFQSFAFVQCPEKNGQNSIERSRWIWWRRTWSSRCRQLGSVILLARPRCEPGYLKIEFLSGPGRLLWTVRMAYTVVLQTRWDFH